METLADEPRPATSNDVLGSVPISTSSVKRLPPLGRSRVRECSPSRAGRPETLKAAVVDCGHSDNVAGLAVIMKATRRDQAGPRCHRARIVVSAFRLIPRVAFLSVVSCPNIPNALDSLIHHARIDHQRGGRVFKPRHYFGEIRKWNPRSRCFAVIANNHRRLIVECEGPFHIVMLVQGSLVVILIDRCKCLPTCGPQIRAGLSLPLWPGTDP